MFLDVLVSSLEYRITNGAVMKILKSIIVTLILLIVALAAFTSCAAPMKIQENSEELAGYTLKNKKELMHQKIADVKCKTVMATP